MTKTRYILGSKAKKKSKPLKAREPYARPTQVHQSKKSKIKRGQLKSTRDKLLDMQSPTVIILDQEDAQVLYNLLTVEIEEKKGMSRYLGGGVEHTLKTIRGIIEAELERGNGVS